VRIAVGKKGLADGKAEWKLRSAKEFSLVPVNELAEKLTSFYGRS
jgi:prolyl-tRNA synthetase